MYYGFPIKRLICYPLTENDRLPPPLKYCLFSMASISHFRLRWIIDELSLLTKILHGHLLPLFHGAYKLCLLPIYRRHYPFDTQRVDAKWASIPDSVNYWMQNRWRWLLSLAPIKSFINGGNFVWRKPWEKYLNICFCDDVMLFSRLVFASTFLMCQMGTGRYLYCFPHFALKLKKYAASLFMP